VSILETSGIVYLLQPYHSNVNKRMIKRPKLYFTDTGLCAYLTKWTSPETLEAGAMSGAFFENYVVIEVLKSYYNRGREPYLYFYRDKDQREIDMLLFHDDRVVPLEIKKSADPTKSDIRNFAVLSKLNEKVDPGGVICLYHDYLPLDPLHWIIPVSVI